MLIKWFKYLSKHIDFGNKIDVAFCCIAVVCTVALIIMMFVFMI